MINKSICIIPARSGSKGLIDKNILKLDGRPLLQFPIIAALESNKFDKVVVSTDSAKYAEIAKDAGAEVPFLRPKELSSDNSSSIDVALHCLDHFESTNQIFENLCLLEPTSPLTSGDDIRNAFNLLLSSQVSDSLVGVGECVSHHPNYLISLKKDKLISPYLKSKENLHIRRQDLSGNVYFFDGSIYLSKVKAFLANKSFYHDKTMAMLFPKHKNLEIDDYTDYILIKAIYAELKSKANNIK